MYIMLLFLEGCPPAPSQRPRPGRRLKTEVGGIDKITLCEVDVRCKRKTRIVAAAVAVAIAVAVYTYTKSYSKHAY